MFVIGVTITDMLTGYIYLKDFDKKKQPRM